MAKIVAPVRARVEVIGKLKESTYQPGNFYRSVLFVDLSQPAGSEAAKVWKSLAESECEGLVVGATVQLVPAGLDKNGKAKHNIVLDNAPIDEPTPTATGWTPAEKKAIAVRVEQHSDLLRFCLETAQRKFGDLVQTEESVRCLATTLFIQAQK